MGRIGVDDLEDLRSLRLDPTAFIRLLDSPQRVIIEVRPVAIAASHDSRKMTGDGRGGKEQHG